VAARMNAQPIGTKCRIPVATGKAAQLVAKRVASRATRYDLFASRSNAVTIIREITFALLTAVGAVAGSELIVRMWHLLKVVL
jgi:hypothetical protein